jgi:fatty acid desaturase
VKVKNNVRNYSLNGEETKKAFDKSLVRAEWYRTEIPRDKLKQLMKRKDGPAIRDTSIWLAMLFIFGYMVYVSWGTWWVIPAILVYGNIYHQSAISRWHECGHGTAFKTAWMNSIVYHFASFMILMQATPWQWSHARHHIDTIIVGRDPEIIAPRPPNWVNLIPPIINVRFFHEIWTIIRRAIGRLTDDEVDYIPQNKYRKVIWEARLYVLVLLVIWGGSIFYQIYWLPILVVFPILYGTVLAHFTGLCQHIGLHEDVLDHRLNSRTFYTNPFLRFIYWNMNYHIEHHMYPNVPYYSLSKLHETIKHDCPPASKSFIAASKEAFTAIWIQKDNPNYTIQKKLPPSATPYRAINLTDII